MSAGEGKDTIRRLTEQFKASVGRYRFVWLILLLGLILMLIPSGEKEAKPEADTEMPTAFDLSETEARLSEALSRMEGAGPVTVVLTVEDGPRRVLAENTDGGGDLSGATKETVVLARGSGQEETVTIQEVYPRYQGALLVCPGGDDPTVRLQLTQAMSALTGLGADKISISKGK